MAPSSKTMPPIICTSKWRIPRVRLEASRTTAKAGTRRSSNVLPAANSARKLAVLAFRSASERAANSASSWFISSTGARYLTTFRSLVVPKSFAAIERSPSIWFFPCFGRARENWCQELLPDKASVLKGLDLVAWQDSGIVRSESTISGGFLIFQCVAGRQQVFNLRIDPLARLVQQDQCA